MPVEIRNLDNFPIDPANSLQTMQAMRDVIMRLQQTVADNYAADAKRKGVPWVSNRLIRVTTYTGFGANWYGGRMQVKNNSVALDPTVDFDASMLYGDLNANADDCYVLDLSANKLPASTHLSCVDSTIYAWGTFLDYSIGKAANSSTNTPAVSRRPIFEATAMTLIPVLVKITGSATRYGVYTARIWKVNGLTAMDTTTASAFANTDLGSDPGVDNAYAFNTREVGASSGHILSSSSTPNLIPGIVVGRAAADNKVCVFVDECQ